MAKVKIRDRLFSWSIILLILWVFTLSLRETFYKYGIQGFLLEYRNPFVLIILCLPFAILAFIYLNRISEFLYDKTLGKIDPLINNFLEKYRIFWILFFPLGLLLVGIAFVSFWSVLIYILYFPIFVGEFIINVIIFENIMGLMNCEIYFQKECMDDPEFYKKIVQNEKTLNYYKLLLREERFYSPI